MKTDFSKEMKKLGTTNPDGRLYKHSLHPGYRRMDLNQKLLVKRKKVILNNVYV